jgi:Mor family transcriptional regulator
MKDVYELLTEEDLTSDLQLLQDICGIDTIKSLLRNFGGLSFYIPKITRLDSLVLKYIKTHSDRTYKQMAKELNVSEQYLKLLIKRQMN